MWCEMFASTRLLFIALLVLPIFSLPPNLTLGDEIHGGESEHAYQRSRSGNRNQSWGNHHPPQHKPDHHRPTRPVVQAPSIESGHFVRPYPFHLDYYRMRWGGSYEPYFGNLHGPANIIVAPSFVAPNPFFGNQFNNQFGTPFGNQFQNQFGNQFNQLGP